MSNFFQDTVHIFASVNDLVVIRNYIFKNRTNIIYDVLNWLEKPGIHANTVKCKCYRDSVSHIPFSATQDLIKPHHSKVEATMGIKTPKNKIPDRMFHWDIRSEP